MALPNVLSTREYEKFVLDSNSDTAVRIVGEVSSLSLMDPPSNADAITVEYPSATTEIFKFRLGGLVGTILRTVTVVYTDSSKVDLSSVEVT